MEWTSAYAAILSGVCFTIALLLLLTTSIRKPTRKLPPGPPGWPVIGNLFDLGEAPHRSFTNLSNKYGPVIWLKLGAVNTMVVSSAEAAMEMFKNHDYHFSGRTTSESVRVLNFGQGTMTMVHYGAHWRMLRRMFTTELTTKAKLNETKVLRAKGIDNMIRLIHNEAQENGSVKIRWFVSLAGFNTIGSVSLSKDNMVDPQSQQGIEYFTLINKVMEWVGTPNIADFFPVFQWLDPQGIKKGMKKVMVPVLNYSTGFVRERILERQKGQIHAKKDILDVMLEFRGTQKGEPTEMSEKEMSITITELFLGATDSTASTVEWAMVELLRNPNMMRKLQDEIDQIVGPGNKVEEDDIEKLKYLQAVVKETLRLHSPAPLLVPRKAMEDTIFMGYTVPKDTQIMVNVWAIGIDPAWWEDPLSFKPERFLGSNIDFKGQHYQFLPFGGGRRICPGQALGQRMLHLVLGSLVHSFDWSLEDGISPEEINMGERFGMIVQKREPLMAVPKPRVVLENRDTIAD